MARRKKEPEGFHADAIARAAGELFLRQGITNTTMDHIAKYAGYSKATLYVYFKSKEEIVALLTLESMKMLYESISFALQTNEDTKTKYDALCNELVKYQSKYPLYFEMALSEINIDFDKPSVPKEDMETYKIGERINEQISSLISEGIKQGDLRPDIDISETGLLFWASLAGIILMAERKEAYLQEALAKPKEDFVKNGFNLLYKAIENHKRG